MSFDIFTAFATDENLENNGTNFPLPGGASLLIARGGNRKYSKALTKAVEANRVVLDGDDEDAAEKMSDQIMVDVMAETILLGWNKVSFRGESLGDYSKEKAKKVLAVKDFRKHVAGLADKIDAFKIKAEVETGNV